MSAKKQKIVQASPKTGPDYAVPALDRGLDVLEVLAACGTRQTLSNVARRMHQSPSAVFRLLSRLQRRSYVIRDELSGQYSLSLKLFELAHTHSPVDYILNAASRPVMELAELVNESVHLTVLSHGRLVVLLDVGSPSQIRLAYRVGSQFSPITTNSGRLLLAYLSPEDLEQFFSKDGDYASLSKPDREEFNEKLVRIRRDRYAITVGEEIPGMKDLAVLVGNPAIGTTAALAIACLGKRRVKVDSDRLIASLQECAGQITNSLGLTYQALQKP